MSLRSQRRLAAEILKVGEEKVWIDSNRTEDVEAAITREDIRKLVHEGVIQRLPKQGVSRARARVLREKKKKGLRRGPGTKSGSNRAKITKKESWMRRIRALRRTLHEWKTSRAITEDAYRKLYKVANGGVFSSIADMERYAKAHGLWRKR